MRHVVPILLVCVLGVAFGGASPAAQPVTIRIAGSTTLLPLVRDAAAAYSATHPEVAFVVSGGGSRAGLDRLRDSSVDVAMTDSAPPADSGLVDQTVAALTLAIIANPDAGIAKLTTPQIRDIFGGAVTNWKAVGGSDRPIALVDRSPGLLVHTIFTHAFMDKTAVTKTVRYADSSQAALTQVSSTPGAVSYVVTRGLALASVVPIAIDGTAPSDANTMAGTYHFWTYEHFVTARAPTLDVSRFFAFLETQRALLHKHGFIAVEDIK